MENTTDQKQLSNERSIKHHNPSSQRLVQLVNRKVANTNMFPGNYDPMVGIKTAASLGSFLLLITACVIYKATCGREVWTSEDRLFIERYKVKLTERKAGIQNRHHSSVKQLRKQESIDLTRQWVRSNALPSLKPLINDRIDKIKDSSGVHFSKSKNADHIKDHFCDQHQHQHIARRHELDNTSHSLSVPNNGLPHVTNTDQSWTTKFTPNKVFCTSCSSRKLKKTLHLSRIRLA